MSLPTLAHPGLLLGPSTRYLPGPGTHVHASQIYASLAGPVLLTPPPPRSTTTSTSTSDHPSTTTTTTQPTLSIPRLFSNTSALPAVNTIVLCRVTRIQSRQATVAILIVEEDDEDEGGGGGGWGKGKVCGSGGGGGFAGVVRREDVRATEKDRVVLGESFRVGDLVRGVVISLGDQSHYYLSTARNELGVVMAWSEAGEAMVPVSWKEFEVPGTGVREGRKVAKPF